MTANTNWLEGFTCGNSSGVKLDIFEHDELVWGDFFSCVCLSLFFPENPEVSLSFVKKRSLILVPLFF